MKKLTLTTGLAIVAISCLVVQAANPGSPLQGNSISSDRAQQTFRNRLQSQPTEIQLPAVVKPSMFVKLPSLTPGIIDTLNVKEGQSVRKGEVLVQLDARVAQARLAAAAVRANVTGALEVARVDRRRAEERLQRIQRVVSTGAGRSYELQEAQGVIDQATATIKQQQDQLDMAESERQLAEAQLSELQVVAPFDGIITRIHQKAGAVDPSVVLIEMANLAELEVELNVPSRRFGQLQVGQTIQMNADIPISSIVSGQLLAVSPIIDSASDTFRCLVRINNQDGRLPAGFRVKLKSE